MGQSNCGRMAAALMTFSFALSPALAMDRVAVERVAIPPVANDAVALDRMAGPCPTRFDYVVLASFADAPSLLSLSSYHFRSEAGFSTIPSTGWLRVDYRVEFGTEDCRARGTPFRRSN
jgi:hypothetical protein